MEEGIRTRLSALFEGAYRSVLDALVREESRDDGPFQHYAWPLGRGRHWSHRTFFRADRVPNPNVQRRVVVLHAVLPGSRSSTEVDLADPSWRSDVSSFFTVLLEGAPGQVMGDMDRMVSEMADFVPWDEVMDHISRSVVRHVMEA